MKILVPVDASTVALAPIAHLQAVAASGMEIEVLLLNVQPRFHRHIAQFTSRRARDALRQERGQLAMAKAIEALSHTRLRWRTLVEVGRPAERIVAVAEREQVDEIMMGVARHPQWLGVLARGQAGFLERYALPAGVAGLAALILSAE
jgi:nucleotide-binding universal stress UspA family protein